MLFKNYDYFLSIVEEKSLSKAADKLYISQPALSKYLKRLEANLGVELFDHSSSPLKLTYTGERYNRYVMEVMALGKKLEKEFSEIQNKERGKVNFGVASWRGSCILPEIIPVFTANHPKIEVSFLEGRSALLINALINEKIDFAIMNLNPSMDFTHLNYEIIMQEHIMLAGNDAHPLVIEALSKPRPKRQYPHFDITRIKNEQLFLTKPGQGLTTAVSALLSKHHLDPEKVLEMLNLTTAINLVSANMGFTFIPEGGTKRNLIPKNISLFTVDEPALTWPLAVVYKKSTYTTSYSKMFIDTLKEHYSSFHA